MVPNSGDETGVQKATARASRGGKKRPGNGEKEREEPAKPARESARPTRTGTGRSGSRRTTTTDPGTPQSPAEKSTKKKRGR